MPYDIFWNRGHWVRLTWFVCWDLRHRVRLTGPITLLGDFYLIILLLSKFVRGVCLVLLRLRLQSCLLCIVGWSLAINFVLFLLLFSYLLPFIFIREVFSRLLGLLAFLLNRRSRSHCRLLCSWLLKVTRRVLLHDENRLCFYYVCFCRRRVTA